MKKVQKVIKYALILVRNSSKIVFRECKHEKDSKKNEAGDILEIDID